VLKVPAERRPRAAAAGRLDKSRRDSIACFRPLPWEDRLRLRLAVCLLLAGLGSAHAQQTTNTPPPPSLPSTFPTFQTYSSCLMNCDTKSGACQGTCSVSNSPSLTFATTPAGTRPDPGALAQCYLACNTQVLTCKQTCIPPH
jgi:hypothetical protein